MMPKHLANLADESTEAEVAETYPRPNSLDELENILMEKTGALDAMIDRDKGTFSFAFYSPGVKSLMSGPPWALLYPPDAPLNSDPRLDAEALFNKEGLVRSSDEDAARHSKQDGAIRDATGLVWRQYMLRTFDRAILARRVMLSARIQSPSAPFADLPADIWPVLTVVDWENGIARDPQGDLYYSLRAASVRRPSMSTSTVADESKARKVLASELERNPNLTRAEAAALCAAAGFKLSGKAFQRVWPRARERAALKSRAPPGRKRKSSR